MRAWHIRVKENRAPISRRCLRLLAMMNESWENGAHGLMLRALLMRKLVSTSKFGNVFPLDGGVIQKPRAVLIDEFIGNCLAFSALRAVVNSPEPE
jgi:hypothetical protein